MPQKNLTVEELIELLSKYKKDKKVAYYSLGWGICPITGLSEYEEYIYVDGTTLIND